MNIRAPAKINLYLRVLGRRKDGYHSIDTIILPVSLFDEIKLTQRRAVRNPELHVTCDHRLVPEGRKNLAYRAASLLMKEKQIDRAVHIHIRKKIPVGAGLGGGSSDAAAVLVGLNRLFRLGYTRKDLETIAADLGADVPFFIRGAPARARGIGERLTRIGGFPKIWLIILYPEIAVSTAWAYKNVRTKLTKPIVNTSITSPLKSCASLRKLLVNDLELVTVSRYPRIGSLKEQLIEHGAEAALMSGSGSAVFGLFNSRRKALEAYHRLRKGERSQTFLVHVLN
ncbi:MAG TPA: 4-(cytidine 5'-diphospho)-2-C-methyl-D-erythritol kinase [Candidatus Binatia bacterium]|nr:4-(cytidine 5'-diphospho)-2-C-methyl-D-erythritol kinase [Candidatus Binatia bacterium]